MKIAVSYENNTVFQHFGHTENFKIYTVEDGKAVSAEVLPTNGRGHGTMVAFLALNGVDAVLCGGLGSEAKDALEASGILVISGVEGDCDKAVEDFLAGKLSSAGVNCSHHGGHGGESADGEDEGCGCGGDCESNCGGGCSGGCHGGCGGCGSRPMVSGPNVGKTCKTHYRGTFNDGTQFDSSYDRGEPLEFVCGAGQMIIGYDQAVANMAVGESIDVHLMPSEAYGDYDPNAVMEFEIAALRGSEDLSVGDEVYLTDPMGRPIPVKVIAKDDTHITLDANGEMAGKELNFHIELLEAE